MPTVIHEYEGWILTDTGIISCACRQGPPNISITRCPRCNKWMTSEVFERLSNIWEFIKSPEDYSLPKRIGKHRVPSR